MTIKFEQVALHVPNIDAYIESHARFLGMEKWIRDEVVGKVSVFGSPWMESKAQLAFNYDAGYEYELLHYVSGPNWHEAKGKPMEKTFFSHKSIHVEDIEAEKAKYSQFFKIAQEMITESHTNAYLIEQKRTYHYVIFDSEEQLGYDLKLIKRIQA